MGDKQFCAMYLNRENMVIKLLSDSVICVGIAVFIACLCRLLFISHAVCGIVDKEEDLYITTKD